MNTARSTALTAARRSRELAEATDGRTVDLLVVGLGVTGADRKKWRRERVFTLKRMTLPVLEIAMGSYMLMCIWISLTWNIGRSSIPFLLIFIPLFWTLVCAAFAASSTCSWVAPVAP